MAALLALDHYATYPEQLALGVVTCGVLVWALTRVSVERRAQALGVVAFATLGEVMGSLIWGVYSYRLHNLPLFVPLLLLFLWRGRNRAIYAGVFLVVAALELYGTAIGTWRWARVVPGLGIADGNPPSGVAAGYVWFDVMALLTAPLALALIRRRAARTRHEGERPLQSTTPA